jgi:hypothetical protein
MKKSLLNRYITIAIVFLCSLPGCAPSPSPAPTATPFDSPLATPDPSGSFTSPLPTPVAHPLVLPTPPSADVATIGGRLVRDLGGRDNEPMVGYKVYLAEIVRADDGTAMMVAVDEGGSPLSLVGENGAVVFTNVPPNVYGLAITTPLGSFLIKDESGTDLLFDVQAGQVLDFGEVRTALPY